MNSQIAAGAMQQGEGQRAGSSTAARPGTDNESGSSGFSDSENDQEERTNDDMPECWAEKQATEKKELYPWLIYQGKALGHSTCNKVNAAGPEMGGKHKHVAEESIKVKVVASGITKSTQQQSLHKKIHHQWKA